VLLELRAKRSRQGIPHSHDMHKPVETDPQKRAEAVREAGSMIETTARIDTSPLAATSRVAAPLPPLKCSSGEVQLADKRIGRMLALNDHVSAAREGDHDGAAFAGGLAHKHREVRGIAGDERGMVWKAALKLGVIDHRHDEVKRGILSWGGGA
jgi:hypothetical protein